MHSAVFTSLLTLFALASAAPTRILSGRSPQSTLPVSPDDPARQVPTLESGNLLLTPQLTVQVDSGIRFNASDIVTCSNPSGDFEPCRYQGHMEKKPSKTSSTDFDEISTFSVFNIPEIARNHSCKFHFFLGLADGGRGNGHVFSLLNGAGLPNEHTTYENKPPRDQRIARFAVVLPSEVGKDDADAVFEVGGEEFPCPVGPIAWEVVPADEQSTNWVVNKGLSIEIMGVAA